MLYKKKTYDNYELQNDDCLTLLRWDAAGKFLNTHKSLKVITLDFISSYY